MLRDMFSILANNLLPTVFSDLLAKKKVICDVLGCFGHHTPLFHLIEPCACRYEFRQDLVNHGMFVIQTFQNKDEIISFLCLLSSSGAAPNHDANQCLSPVLSELDLRADHGCFPLKCRLLVFFNVIPLA